LNIHSEFVNGLRRTTEEVLDVVEMVLAGSINKTVVGRVNAAGGHAVGLSGTDGNLLLAHPVPNANEVGFVGDVKKVNTKLLRDLIGLGITPVVAPVGVDEAGQRYNINADIAAGAVASQLGVKQMIVVTDVPGILKEIDGQKVVLPSVTKADIEAMIASEEIYGGMIPKVRSALDCLHGHVEEVVIVNGNEPNVLSRVIHDGEKIGTRIVRG
jgi:acetylglutamate kinase